MADKLDTQQRHHCMSRIRGKDTKPELLVRKGLHARGFRFRLQDIWHGHGGCRYATKPKSNIEFWETKIARNKHRDEVTAAHLEALGWTVIIVWECELRGKEKAEARIQTLAEEIRSSGELKKQKEDRRRLSRAAAKREREQMLERQAALEEEIKRLYPISIKLKIESKKENYY